MGKVQCELKSRSTETCTLEDELGLMRPKTLEDLMEKELGDEMFYAVEEYLRKHFGVEGKVGVNLSYK